MKENTYGRKQVKIKNTDAFQKLLILSWIICFVVGIALGSAITVAAWKIEDRSKVDGKEITFTRIETEWGGAEDFVELDVPMDKDLQEFVYFLSSANNIDYAFVMALIETESTFEADKISNTDDYGLMQINEVNHAEITEALGITNYLDPYENIEAGIFMLRNLFDKYEDPEKVLMAYNLGERGAKNLWEKGITKTTYTEKVTKSAVEFNKQIKEKEGEK